MCTPNFNLIPKNIQSFDTAFSLIKISCSLSKLIMKLERVLFLFGAHGSNFSPLKLATRVNKCSLFNHKTLFIPPECWQLSLCLLYAQCDVVNFLNCILHAMKVLPIERAVICRATAFDRIEYTSGLLNFSKNFINNSECKLRASLHGGCMCHFP